jgi:hypothetical protein
MVKKEGRGEREGIIYHHARFASPYLSWGAESNMT